MSTLPWSFIGSGREPIMFDHQMKRKRAPTKGNHFLAIAASMLPPAMRNNIAGGNMDAAMAKKWFPFVGALFLFIWWSNMIGSLPLPMNDHGKVDIFGLELPSFGLYAATANISVTLVLTLMVWVAYHVEGVRAKG